MAIATTDVVAGALLRFLQTNQGEDEVFAPDLFVDMNVPEWRFQMTFTPEPEQEADGPWISPHGARPLASTRPTSLWSRIDDGKTLDEIGSHPPRNCAPGAEYRGVAGTLLRRWGASIVLLTGLVWTVGSGRASATISVPQDYALGASVRCVDGSVTAVNGGENLVDGDDSTSVSAPAELHCVIDLGAWRWVGAFRIVWGSFSRGVPIGETCRDGVTRWRVSDSPDGTSWHGRYAGGDTTLKDQEADRVNWYSRYFRFEAWAEAGCETPTAGAYTLNLFNESCSSGGLVCCLIHSPLYCILP